MITQTEIDHINIFLQKNFEDKAFVYQGVNYAKVLGLIEFQKITRDLGERGPVVREVLDKHGKAGRNTFSRRDVLRHLSHSAKCALKGQKKFRDALKRLPKSDLVLVLKDERFINYASSVLKGLAQSHIAPLILMWSPTENLPLKNCFNISPLLETTHLRLWGNPKLEAQFGYLHDSLSFFSRALKKIKPKLLVFFEGNDPNDRLFAEAAKNLGIKTACVQYGWNPMLGYQWKNLNFNYFLSWGRRFSEPLKELNPGMEFFEVGHPGLKPEKTPIRNSSEVLLLCQPNHPLYIDDSSQQKLAELINLIAKSKKDTKFKIRLHPRQGQNSFASLASHKNIEIIDSRKVSLHDSLKMARVVVGFYSSTLYESMAYGCSTIFINVTPREPEPDISKDGLGVVTKSIDEAKEYILGKLSADQLPPEQNTIRATTKKYFEATGDEAVQNIISQISNLMGNDMV